MSLRNKACLHELLNLNTVLNRIFVHDQLNRKTTYISIFKNEFYSLLNLPFFVVVKYFESVCLFELNLLQDNGNLS